MMSTGASSVWSSSASWTEEGAAMARQVRRSEGWLGRVGLVLLAVLVVWFLVSAVLGFVFSLIRTLLFIALFAIVAWFVLIGPPDRHD
jgi:uncharacterized membrane protein